MASVSKATEGPTRAYLPEHFGKTQGLWGPLPHLVEEQLEALAWVDDAASEKRQKMKTDVNQPQTPWREQIQSNKELALQHLPFQKP